MTVMHLFIVLSCILPNDVEPSVLIHSPVTISHQVRTVMAYVYPGSGSPITQNSLIRNSHILTHISPCWLTITDAEGGMRAALDIDRGIISICNEKGIHILPRLAQKDFSRPLVHGFLRNQPARLKVAQNTRDWLLANNCHGVNLDFEYVPSQDRTQLTKFVSELHACLKPAGLQLTMAVPAKTRDDLSSEWSGAFDYARLGRFCDAIILMAYDEHWGTSRPGPVASTPFVEKVLAYATESIPKEKILLGMPFYARDWPEKGRGRSWTGQEVLNLIEGRGARPQWDARAESSWFEYRDDEGKRRTVWFETTRSLASKVFAAHRFDVAGVSIWRLGNEDPAYWLPIAHYKAGRGWKGLIATVVTAARNLNVQ